MKIINLSPIFKRLEKLDWVIILTLFYLILYTKYSTNIRMAHLFLGTWGLLLYRHSKHFLYWMVISIVQFIYLYSAPYTTDNHKFLFAYWIFALTISLFLGRKNPKKLNLLIEHNSKWLIGLAMAFAIFWKTYSPDYLSGQFMSFTLIDDKRFLFFVKFLTDLPADYFELIDYQFFGIKFSYLGFKTSNLYEVYFLKQVKTLGLFFTWWVYVIELLIAVLFLLPEKFKLHKIRTFALLIFIFSTYFFLGIIGFGWLLTILGLAQINEKNKHFVGYFLATFVLIKIFTFLPFQNSNRDDESIRKNLVNKAEQNRPQGQTHRSVKLQSPHQARKNQ